MNLFRMLFSILIPLSCSVTYLCIGIPHFPQLAAWYFFIPLVVMLTALLRSLLMDVYGNHTIVTTRFIITEKKDE